jgi:hypothetical protein
VNDAKNVAVGEAVLVDGDDRPRDAVDRAVVIEHHKRISPVRLVLIEKVQSMRLRLPENVRVPEVWIASL